VATSNDQLVDAIIAHQIELIRYGKGLSSRIIALLNRSEPELQRRLRARLELIAPLPQDPGPSVTRKLIITERLIKTILDPTWKTINELVRKELVGLAVGEVAWIADKVKTAIPVIWEPNVPTPRQLRSIVFARPFQNRLLRDWLSSYEANDRRRMMEQIRQGLLFDETPTQIGRRIFGTRAQGGVDGTREITRRGAQTLAQTATSAITNGTRQRFYNENKRIIPREVFVATLDSRTTPVCQSLDGQIYPTGEGPIPPIHMNCRSIRAPVVDGRRLGTRPASSNFRGRLGNLRGPARRREVAKLIGRVPAETTYNQFLSRQSAAFQDNVLGPTRGRLFRAGEFDVQGFVDNSGERYTLRQLYEQKPQAFQKLGIPAPAG
jgi:SPP1 gp7 family putative phage head morphogenesis protein